MSLGGKSPGGFSPGGTALRRLVRAWSPEAAGDEAREVAGLCDEALARGDRELELRPWEWSLRETVLVAIAASRGFAPAGGAADRGSWWIREPLVLAAGGGAR